MKRDTINYVAVGGFVLLMLLALAILLLLVTGRTGAADHYHVRYSNVAGLRYGTPVYFQGYGIGQVDEITPEHEEGKTRYRVELAIRKGWPVPEDSVARVVSSGLLSDVTIEIGGGKSTEPLSPGSELVGQEGGDVFMAFNELAAEIRTLTRNSIKPFVEQLGQTMGDSAPVIAELRELIGKLNRTADGVSQMFGPDNQKELAQLLRRANAASGNAEKLTADLLATRRELDGLLGQANAMITENRPEAQRAMRELRVSLQAVSERIDTIMHQLDGTTRNLQEFSREIRANPNRLLSGTPPEDEAR